MTEPYTETTQVETQVDDQGQATEQTVTETVSLDDQDNTGEPLPN